MAKAIKRYTTLTHALDITTSVFAAPNIGTNIKPSIAPDKLAPSIGTITANIPYRILNAKIRILRYATADRRITRNILNKIFTMSVTSKKRIKVTLYDIAITEKIQTASNLVNLILLTYMNATYVIRLITKNRNVIKNELIQTLLENVSSFIENTVCYFPMHGNTTSNGCAF